MKRIFPIFLGAVLMAPLTSFAATFKNECAPEAEYHIGELAPNLGFMLDRSGSMVRDSSTPGVSRWVAAKTAINETVQSFTTNGVCSNPNDPKCDTVRFGLGLFSSAADFNVPAGEDQKDNIALALAVGTTGITRMGLAAQALETEASLNDSTRTNHAIFITDGYPYAGCSYQDNQDTLIDAVIALCNAQNRANTLRTNVIGFGGDTHALTLHLLAAAGGTGECSDSSANPIDVCALDRATLNGFLKQVTRPNCDSYALPDSDKITCTGAINITSNTELKNEIAGIVEEASCTFPLEIPAGYPGNAASADPAYTRVELEHNIYGHVPLQNVGDCDAPTSVSTPGLPAEYEKEGWCFVNDRRAVRLTAKLCQEIGAREVHEVKTQLACYCAMTGQSCGVPVVCDGGPCTLDQLNNMPCSSGTYVCQGGVDVCTPSGSGKLPEICNGVDDNCDGIVDNLRTAEADWDLLAPALKTTTGLHCEFEDVCACQPGISAAITYSGGVPALLSAAIPECSCQAGLEFDESPFSGGDEEESEQSPQAAGCSAINNGPSDLLYFLLPVGFFGLIRRRKRR